MESITKSIIETAKEWGGAKTEEGILDNVIESMAHFSADLYMPDLNPIMVAVCCYARVTDDVEKVNAVIETMKHLNNLAIHIAHYGEILTILEWSWDKHIRPTKEKEDNA